MPLTVDELESVLFWRREVELRQLTGHHAGSHFAASVAGYYAKQAARAQFGRLNERTSEQEESASDL